jgi:molybdenum cofactor cytidylyltransferase
MLRGGIAAVILAAGKSSRMGSNKLVLEINGRPMLRHVAEAAIASRARPVVAVLGNDSAAVATTLEGLDIVLLENPDFRDGLSASIRIGIAALPETVAGALILLGDMPAISPGLIDRVIEAFDGSGGSICVATHNTQRGHPVLFARRYFPEFLKLEGDVGARGVIETHADYVLEIETEDDGPLVDIDTPDALAEFRALRS